MKCPACGKPSEVRDTRHAGGRNGEAPYIRRRRLCAQGHRFSTIEQPAVGQHGKGLMDTITLERAGSLDRAVAAALQRMAYKIRKGGLVGFTAGT